jgi:DNA-binding NtrC family response regulator
MDVRVGDRRVLVAEDEFVIALEIEDTLRRAGYEVVGPAATAGEAERLAAEEPLDAAVLDLELRDGTAVAAADALAGRGIPFVFLSGYGVEALPGHLRGRAVLDKPFAVERLPAALAETTRQQRVRERAHAIWGREGRPQGQEKRHWAEAEAELRAEEDRDRARDRGPSAP